MPQPNDQTFPYQRSCPMQPPSQYANLRAEQPISSVTLASGRKAWLLTKHEHISQMLTNPNVSSNLALPGYPLHFEAPTEVLERMRPVMLAMDPPVHTAQRRLMIPEFTHKQVSVLRPRIQAIVDERIDHLLASGNTADLVEHFAVPVPSLVICELLGVPYSDREYFQKRTKKLVSIDVDHEERGAAHLELREYFDQLLDAKQAEPTDDLLSRLVVKNRENSVLTRDEMIGMANVLLVGGHETTANMIALGVLGLLEHPDQLKKLMDDPTRAGGAVDELLRYFSIADQVTSRVATANINIGGVDIEAGDGIIGLSASANHDDSVFEDPARFNIERDARKHLAFGKGIHQCIGMNLARLELEIALVTIFSRIPSLQLRNPINDLPFKDNRSIYGLLELPVRW